MYNDFDDSDGSVVSEVSEAPNGFDEPPVSEIYPYDPPPPEDVPEPTVDNWGFRTPQVAEELAPATEEVHIASSKRIKKGIKKGKKGKKATSVSFEEPAPEPPPPVETEASPWN